ncbi:phasin family protein [Bradyrhizobium sp. ARR65]|uniref:phasin family protein n=1 Tax=Bradyrhizobium sp. ARR65 TaxID=1040989 RepID=UPI000686C5E5|nr:phasin family protein [Bradyrhizobium sp. ARR65]
MRFLDKAQVDQAAKLLSSQAKAQSTIKKKAPRPCSSLNPGHIIMNLTGGTTMTEPKLEVPAELRQLAERTIDQAEQVFALLFDAARRSTAAGTTSTAELTKQVLAFSEESLKTSFEHARKVASTASLQDVATAQSELVKRQIAGAEHHIRELARATGSKDRT